MNDYQFQKKKNFEAIITIVPAHNIQQSKEEYNQIADDGETDCVQLKPWIGLQQKDNNIH
jgi:sulfatase maturation enzyme AslB (radical SAM superfamily)